MCKLQRQLARHGRADLGSPERRAMASAHRPGPAESPRNLGGAHPGQRSERAQAGPRHQQPTARIRSDLTPHGLVEEGGPLAQRPRSGQRGGTHDHRLLRGVNRPRLHPTARAQAPRHRSGRSCCSAARACLGRGARPDRPPSAPARADHGRARARASPSPGRDRPRRQNHARILRSATSGLVGQIPRQMRRPASSTRQMAGVRGELSLQHRWTSSPPMLQFPGPQARIAASRAKSRTPRSTPCPQMLHGPSGWPLGSGRSGRGDERARAPAPGSKAPATGGWSMTFKSRIA